MDKKLAFNRNLVTFAPAIKDCPAIPENLDKLALQEAYNAQLRRLLGNLKTELSNVVSGETLADVQTIVETFILEVGPKNMYTIARPEAFTHIAYRVCS